MKQKEKTELTKAKIIQFAMEEFGSLGYARGTVNGICRKGVQKGLIYHNFKDRDELYLTCVSKACELIIREIEQTDCSSDPLSYMEARRELFRNHPLEARIFFEALIHPADHLKEQIGKILLPFNRLNESVYEKILDSLQLRNGVSREDALAYYRQMEQMFNCWYSLQSASDTPIDQQIEEHELSLSRLLDFMFYGIAKEKVEK